jgi:hypothetical protein
MATNGIVQRGLQSLNDTVRAVRTGEGEGAAAKLGRTARRGLQKAKDSLGSLKTSLGLSTVDAYEEETPDENQRRKKTKQLLGQDEPIFVARSMQDKRDFNTTIAPEFRAQVAAGLASANSFTAGSTLVDGRSTPDDET